MMKRYNFSDAKKYDCVFCGSKVKPKAKISTMHGRKKIVEVNCSNPECKSLPMKVGDWVRRGMYYENRETPEKVNFSDERKALSGSKYRASSGLLISQLKTVNASGEIEMRSDNKDIEKGKTKPRAVPDWVVLAVRWAKEFGRVPINDIDRYYGASCSGIIRYISRIDLEPKPEHSELWERLKSKDWRNDR